MSRAYRINWIAVTGSVTSSDAIKLDVALLGILPEAEMTALLRDELAAAGWQTARGGALERAISGATARLAPDGKAVTVTLETSNELHARGVDADAAQRALEAAEKQARERLETDVSRRLAGAEPDVRAALDAAVQKAYLAALKRKAAALGQVQSIEEHTGADGECEITIKVKT